MSLTTGPGTTPRAEDRRITLPALPALVVGEVHHTRHRPLVHSFTHRHYGWLIDLADPPRMPWWARPLSGFRGQDHLTGHDDLGGVRTEVLALLRANRLEVGDESRVVMLAAARVLGYVFNPMSAYWCLGPDGRLCGLVLEVHNTYGGRHAYVVHPDDVRRAHLEKEFYVSPFNDVEGGYRMSATLRDDLVAVSLRLSTPEGALVTASVTGRPRPATPARVVRTGLRHPLMPQRVSALIRAHGVWLWLRRLRVRPRAGGAKGSIR